MHYSRVYSIPIRILRIFSAYGAGLRRQLLWDITRKILDAIATRQDTIPLWGTGEETRDFIHSIDVAYAALRIADARLSSMYEVFNVASGVQVRIRDVAECVCNLWGCNITPVFAGENRLGDPAQWCADISKLTNIGYSPTIPFMEGLRDYVLWANNIKSL
jgi:UDP-glucose 4-epimerase